jgi:hypothetical protein
MGWNQKTETKGRGRQGRNGYGEEVGGLTQSRQGAKHEGRAVPMTEKENDKEKEEGFEGGAA